jgi:ribosomal protein L7Ae-like RNA K-turn-binding protein
MNKKVYSYIGLAQKAGKLKSGEGACEKAIAKGEGKLVVISEDASANTIKKFSNKAKYYNVEYCIKGPRGDLSCAIGKTNRPVVVITDRGLAEKIKEFL